ncbi:MAG: hypothetical protein NC131_18210 [Roseburia sp.]|nr:hypothetical protein [Roseburia sp.]
MVYVGKTQRFFAKRMSEHEYALRHGVCVNQHLQNAYDKYGPNSFVWDVIELMPKVLADVCNTRFTNSEKENELWIEWLNEREIFWVGFFRDHGFSYNAADGGEYRYVHQLKSLTKRHISEGQKRSYSLSPTRRARVSESNRERAKDPEYRRKHSEKLKALYATPEGKAIALARGKKRKPGWSDKLSPILRAANARPEVKKRRSEGQIKAYSSPERHAIQCEASQRGALTKQAKFEHDLECANNILDHAYLYAPYLVNLNLKQKKLLILEISTLYGKF